MTCLVNISQNTEMLKIVIPIFNNGNFLESIIKFWRSIEEDPLFLVDAKTTDNSVEILNDYSCNYKYIANQFEFIEQVLFEEISNINNEWVLRVDSDEIFTPESLHNIRQTLTCNLEPYARIVFPRQSVFKLGESLFKVQVPLDFENKCKCDIQWFTTQNHFQARLVNITRNSKQGDLHSPGMTPKVGFSDLIMENVDFYHLDWVYNDFASRKLKFTNYLNLAKTSEIFQQKCYYLPEECRNFTYLQKTELHLKYL